MQKIILERTHGELIKTDHNDSLCTSPSKRNFRYLLKKTKFSVLDKKNTRRFGGPSATLEIYWEEGASWMIPEWIQGSTAAPFFALPPIYRALQFIGYMSFTGHRCSQPNMLYTTTTSIGLLMPLPPPGRSSCIGS
jgi:hypothetical protein